MSPQVPAGCQAWEVSPGEVRSLKTERVVGGTKITLPEFGLTAAIVLTSDSSPTGLLVRFQDQTRRMRKLAAQWAHDLADAEIDKVMKVQAQLERMGHTVPDADGRPLFAVEGAPEGCASADGRVRGTYLHGLLDSDAARRRILDWARATRVAHRAGAAPDARALREAAYDRLADTLDAVLDHARLRELLAL